MEEISGPPQHCAAMVTHPAEPLGTCGSTARDRKQGFARLRWPWICGLVLGMTPFKADIEEIRRRALDKMENGAVTASYKADRERVIAVLNEVLATETVCVLRYKSHYYMARASTRRESRTSSSSTRRRSRTTPIGSPSGSPSSAARRT